MARLQILHGLGVLTKLAREPVGGGSEGREQRLVGIGTGGAGTLGDRDSDAARDFADRGRIVHAEALHKEGVDVAGFVADEAVEHPLLGNDGEVAVRAAVERAAAAIVRARALELDRLADDSDDVRGIADLLDDVVGNHLNSTTVTPLPP